MKPIGNIFGFDCATCEHNRHCYGGNMGNQFRYCQKSAEKIQNLDNLEKQNKQLKDNWNKLKEDLINDINDRNGTKIAEFEDGNRVSETISPIYTLMEDRSKTIKEVLDKMQEIEKERNSNAKD